MVGRDPELRIYAVVSIDPAVGSPEQRGISDHALCCEPLTFRLSHVILAERATPCCKPC